MGDNFNDIKQANSEAQALARRERATQEAKQRRQRALEKRAAVKAGQVAGKQWGANFTKQPRGVRSCVRARTLKAGKAGGSAAHAYAHNLRTMPTNPDHIDPAQSHQNYLAHQTRHEDGRPVLPGEILAGYKARGLLSGRSESEGVEMLFALSPSLWEAATPEARPELVRAFGDECAAFLRAGKFRYGRLLQVVVHADEPDAAPTCKAVFLPLVPAFVRGKKGEGHKKWMRQELDPATGAGLLNPDGTPKMAAVVEVSRAKFGLSGKQALSDLQTDFANHLRQKGWDIERGEVREPANHQKHRSTKVWRAEQEAEAIKNRHKVVQEAREVADSIVTEAEAAAAAAIEAAKATAAAEIERMKAEAAADIARRKQEAERVCDATERRALAFLSHTRLTVEQVRADFERREKERESVARYAEEKAKAATEGAQRAPEFVSRERAEAQRRQAQRDGFTARIAEGLEKPAQQKIPKKPGRGVDM